MREDFEIVKAQTDIKNVACYLMGEPTRGEMFRFPGERTPSIKIYEDTQTFFDYGRCAGGDVVGLYSHVKDIDNWQALKEICSLYNIDTTDSHENIREQIERQEMVQKARKDAEKQRKRRWVKEVDDLKNRLERDATLLEGHAKPFTDVWVWALEDKLLTERRLDDLCGVE